MMFLFGGVENLCLKKSKLKKPLDTLIFTVLDTSISPKHTSLTHIMKCSTWDLGENSLFLLLINLNIFIFQVLKILHSSLCKDLNLPTKICSTSLEI